MQQWFPTQLFVFNKFAKCALFFTFLKFVEEHSNNAYQRRVMLSVVHLPCTSLHSLSGVNSARG